MTKFFSGLLALTLLAFSFTAEAGWNLRQNDDGTADWVREDSASTQDTRTVGAVYLTVLLEDVSTASTAAVTIPVTDAEISYIQAVMLGNITGDNAFLDFWIGDGSGGRVHASEVTNGSASGATRMQVTVTSAATGDVFTFTPSDTSTNKVEKNQTLLIHTDGASTGTHDAVITITVIPR